jgi:cytochrome c553
MDIGRRRMGACTLALALVACEPPPAVGAKLPVSGGEARAFSDLVANVLVPKCATGGCHSGNPPIAWPALDAEVAYDAIVGVPSQQLATMNLVEPYDPACSYFVLKLRGTAGDAGGLATPMPVGESLTEAEIQSIEAWIANGAPND